MNNDTDKDMVDLQKALLNKRVYRFGLPKKLLQALIIVGVIILISFLVKD